MSLYPPGPAEGDRTQPRRGVGGVTLACHGGEVLEYTTGEEGLESWKFTC